MRMPRPGKLEISILLAALASFAVLLWGYHHWLVWEEVHRNKGPVKEARSNSFYAAQKFLEAYGKESHLSHSPTAFEEMKIADIPIGDDDAIVLLQGRGVVNGQRFNKLWAWVEAGGTLISSTENPFLGKNHKEDELFIKLGLDVYDSYDYDAEEYEGYADEDYAEEGHAEEDYVEEESVEEHGAEEESVADESVEESVEEELVDETSLTYLDWNAHYCESYDPLAVSFENEVDPLSVAFGWAEYFYADGELPVDWAKQDDAYLFTGFNIGEGRIAVIASSSIWHNSQIACNDHAYFLKKLVGDSPKVWFVINEETPSLFNLAWKGVPLAVIAFIVALIFALWRALLRFGPVFPDTKIERRSFAEHIKAGADFMWRTGLQAELIEQLRRDINSIMNRRSPGFEKLNDVEKLHCLQRHCSLTAQDLEKIYFFPLAQIGKKEFVFIVRQLQALKEQL